MKHIITISSVEDYAYIHLDGEYFGGGNHCDEMVYDLISILNKIGEEPYELKAEEFYSWKAYNEKYHEECDDNEEEWDCED